MGWLDVLCCGFRRRRDVQTDETEVLVAPGRARGRGTSVTSQDGYGTMAMASATTRSSSTSQTRPSVTRLNQAGITEAQKERMHEISRTAGSHMRPIGHYIAGRSVSPLPLRPVLPTSGPSSAHSSRTPSPSPPRPDSNPPDGVISPSHSASSRSRPRSRHWSSSSGTRPPLSDGHASVGYVKRTVSAPVTKEVVHKSIFDGLAPTPSRSQPSSRRSSGSSKKKKARRTSQATRPKSP